MITPRRRRLRTLLASGGALLGITVLSGCADVVDAADPEIRGFGPAAEHLVISVSDVEHLDVRSADVDEIEVTRWFAGSSFMGSTDAIWELDEDRLTLATDCSPFVIGRCDARYEVRVPSGVNVTIEGDSGEVSASGFDTDLTITTSSGRILIDDVGGALALSTESGELPGAGIRSSQADVTSASGEVELFFAEAPEELTTTAQSGEVTIVVPLAPYRVTTTTGSGNVTTQVPTDPNGPHSITVETDSGEITVTSVGS
ncbi:DUF4097 family beta strand repeat-containing protein [Actinoalloteichus sp. GBA129-24]|uniref:DUF4097 family beta strand repeat-containing protein n=1 Tax=Actinoalloteichus sp. GBA129-24 TaxID=1612551 RepID=UPI0009507168|nr:DUF4097 family beta strand repeat-containing protein [Actinoalloteichus sp. GBA129-24]APU22287.1 putative DUF4098 family protein [Actinoalloteichus sp. GBA129-24]